jgi:hypothetical protein
MIAGDQRILDCHAAWVHGCLSTDELYLEVLANTPEGDPQTLAVRSHARMLGEAAARQMERMVLAAFDS